MGAGLAPEPRWRADEMGAILELLKALVCPCDLAAPALPWGLPAPLGTPLGR